MSLCRQFSRASDNLPCQLPVGVKPGGWPPICRYLSFPKQLAQPPGHRPPNCPGLAIPPSNRILIRCGRSGAALIHTPHGKRGPRPETRNTLSENQLQAPTARPFPRVPGAGDWRACRPNAPPCPPRADSSNSGRLGRENGGLVIWVKRRSDPAGQLLEVGHGGAARTPGTQLRRACGQAARALE